MALKGMKACETMKIQNCLFYLKCTGIGKMVEAGASCEIFEKLEPHKLKLL
jgi:hypothetical protein